MRNLLLILVAAVAMAQPPAQPPAAKPAEPPPPTPMTDSKYGTAEQIMALPSAKLIAVLRDRSASEYAKAKACQRLSVIGDKAAVQVIAPLLTDAKLSTYARTALEAIPDPSASDALRDALGTAKGDQLIGVIHSLGYRKDTKAIAELGKLRYGSDPAVAKAADTALGRIRPRM